MCMYHITFVSTLWKVYIYISNRNLPNRDIDYEGVSDPYVILFSSTQREGEHKHWEQFGQTKPVKDSLNPQWDEVFVYQYIEGANQVCGLPLSKELMKVERLIYMRIVMKWLKFIICICRHGDFSWLIKTIHGLILLLMIHLEE